MENVRNIVAVHTGGGSQTLLDNAELPKTLPRWKTCKYSKKEFRKGEFYCIDTNFWKIPMACDNCKTYWLEK